ncbi:outer membrane beta-barrel protein [Bacteroides uniformis]|uniref:TonB-dependent receptor domain-containing protein n=1 Tax=Bacteroides uniformis TaxID=820 RepID=UPI00125DF21B|nr:TonB-dependent receptor [Bacteroides uniformis]KAB3919784.1 outer membrane beta-barrel protein [Bacteroides uniformis]KAB3923198.1 outer membrane beta-barrel protein [Bacteroides uniformis]KAB4020426.1 outer membrane beta-barrel protein [Bacteroides uniformis]KAB4032355.1 outer membrane beta-barrel protein [Bacteroides uniformis]
MKENLLNNVRKKVMVWMALASMATFLSAQTYRLSGCVQDENRQPVEVANVLLKQAKDSAYITGMLTDTQGCFFFDQPLGEYLLHITLIGSEDLYVPVVLQGNKNVGELTLKSSSALLDEVTVTAARPVIKRLVDRVVFDAHNTIASAGGSALDLLREVPGLQVGQNSIGIIGKGGIRVYINDRETKLSGDELIDYLRSYDASQILKVEVITTPPSKYDAAGNAGIINIRLKSRPKDYVGGTASASYSAGEKDNYGYGGVSLNLSKGRVSSFLNGGTTQGNYETREKNYRYFPQNTWNSRADYTNYMNSFYLQGGVDVSLERDWTVGMQAIYNHSAPKPGNALSWTEVYDASTAVLDSLLYSNSDKDTSSDRLNLNFHTDKVWDDKGKKMTWDVDYLRDNRDENMGFLSKTLLPDGTEIPGTNFDYNYLQHRKVDVVSSALDFILPFEKYKITAGAKVSFTNTRNGINYDTSDPTLVQDDYFRYKEQIYALYADYSREFSERFSMQLGLRMEHTRTTGISEAKDTEDKHDYTRLFPTVYLLYSPTDGHALNFSFSNRISRPSQNMVNPFPFYQNKYTYACGREDLKPSYTYNAELGYTLKNNFNVSAYYSYSDDVFFQVVDLDAETNVTSFLWENFMQTHAFGLNNSYTFRTKWLQTYAQHGVSYRRTTSSAATTSPEEKGWAYNASLRNTFFFNEKKTLLATLSGSYSSRQYQGIYLMSPTYSVSAGMLYRLLNNKLSLSLNVNNLFVSHSKLETMSNGLKIIADNQFAFASFRIGVSYTFGGDIRSKGQRNSNEDIQRRL